MHVRRGVVSNASVVGLRGSNVTGWAAPTSELILLPDLSQSSHHGMEDSIRGIVLNCGFSPLRFRKVRSLAELAIMHRLISGTWLPMKDIRLPWSAASWRVQKY